MRWQTEWRLISDRIDGLLKMLQVYNAGLGVLASFSDVRVKAASNDLPETTAEIYRHADDVYIRLIKFREHDSVLPQLARSRLSEVINDFFGRYPNARQRDFKPSYDQTLAFVISLGAFRSEFSLLLADTEAAQRSIVDRAFFHLQRCIVADDSIASRWQSAFSTGETACEKLGAVHLLSFGIYAFKAHSTGERTDLVLGNSVNPSEAERVADALVLTEWKKVDASDLASKAEGAFNQACIYASGSLAGFELASRRYLIMVSQKRLSMPEERSDGAVTYEYRNVAVEPDPPSRAI
jgi:hypothetical protein